MAQAIILPKQGLQMTEGTITTWLVKEGEQVSEGQPLFEMETDKLTITIDSTAGGTLLKILHGEGETVPIAQTIAIVGTPGEDYAALLTGGTTASGAIAPAAPAAPAVAAPAASGAMAPATAQATPGATAPASGNGLSTPRARTRAQEKGIDIQTVGGSGPDGLVIERDVLGFDQAKATPLARVVAQQQGTPLAGIAGSGSHGKIVAADVRAAESSTPASRAASGAPRGEVIIPLSGMRRVVATRMHESLQSMAQTTHRISVDMSEAAKLREQYKAADLKISYNDIVLRVVARALADCPYMNVSFTEQGIVQKQYVNLGMAVALDAGLIVPVIKDADLMTLQEIAAASADLAGRAKDNRLQPDEYTGGTFTVSNLGMFGLSSFTAIVNPPEAGILAVGMIEKKPVVMKDDSIAVRPMLELTLSYDHMAVDGAPAAQFLRRIKQLLENPGLLI